MIMLQVGLLGPVAVFVDGNPVRVTSPRQAALLACLSLHTPRVTAVESIIAALWDEDFPRTAEQAVQQYVSSLRTLLEPGRSARHPSRLLTTEGAGYRLREVDLDIVAFEAATARGRHSAGIGQWAAALADLDAALRYWRGPALSGLPGTPFFLAHQTRLTELRHSAVEARLDALSALGGFGQVIGECEVLLAEEPLHEAVWSRLMVALYRAGRSADALAAFGRARKVLRDELGLEPGEQLRSLERRMLDRDPTLDPPATASVPQPPAPAEVSQTFRADGERLPWLQLPDGQMIVLRQGSYVVGRQPGSDILLLDSRVSRSHAVLDSVAGTVRIKDLGSLNFTTVNGRPVGREQPQELADRDVISIGGVPLAFHRGL